MWDIFFSKLFFEPSRELFPLASMSPLLMLFAAVDDEACKALCFASAAAQQAIIHIQMSKCQKPFL